MSTPTTRNILEQGRAKFAYTCAQRAKDSNHASEYKSFSKKLPMLIKTNGLGSAMAFASYRSDATKAIYKDVTNWLKEDEKEMIDFSAYTNLIEALVSMDSATYKTVSVEVLSFLNWLRRFTSSF